VNDETLEIVLMQTRRGRSWRESVNLALNTLSSSIFRGEAILFMNENWLSREPVNIEDYEYAVEKLSQKYSGIIFAGSNYVVDSDGIIRSIGLSLINGKLVRACEKVFPSRAVGERGRIQGGRIYPPIEVSGWKISCIVCVDIFYPELARCATYLGAHIIYNPASISNDRTNLWHSILLARAAENTVFTIGVNSVGYVYPDGRLTLGQSIVNAPNGAMVGVMGTREVAERFVLNKQVIENIRRRWAFFDDLKNVISREMYCNRIREMVGRQYIVD
jgi:predicted amidohydrolase